VARGRWALDSGGFTELALHRSWVTTPARYVEEVRRFRDHIGRLDWAVIQDWMVDPFTLNRTGKSLRDHQKRTVHSWMELTSRAPDVPWVPVLQGHDLEDVLRHTDDYETASVNWSLSAPVVGLGSVCRRQRDEEVHRMISCLQQKGMRIHVFGMKVTGLKRSGHLVASSDSMAWSYQARRRTTLPGCQHQRCSSCFRYAIGWRSHLLHILRLRSLQTIPTSTLRYCGNRAKKNTEAAGKLLRRRAELLGRTTG
jgi:hypothetical protein